MKPISEIIAEQLLQITHRARLPELCSRSGRRQDGCTACSYPPAAPVATAPAAAPVNSAALNLAVSTAITNLNSAISQAGTVNSDLALATQSCKQAITWLTSAAAKAPTA
jgi:hypothetical protein